MLIVDEAQNLSAHTLEQVRLLTNLETATTKLLQIILIGQPELRDLLARPELRQLAQRITARYHLNPLSSEETVGYVKHRMRVAGATAEAFTPGALREVYRLAGGVPRIINVICDRALLGAFTHEDHRVSSTRRARCRRARSTVARCRHRGCAGRLSDRSRQRSRSSSSALWSLCRRAHGDAPSGRNRGCRECACGDGRCAKANTTTASDPPAPPSFDELLARHGNDTTTEAALGKLFASWGADL